MHPPTGMHITLQLFSRSPTNPTLKGDSPNPLPSRAFSPRPRGIDIASTSGEMDATCRRIDCHHAACTREVGTSKTQLSTSKTQLSTSKAQLSISKTQTDTIPWPFPTSPPPYAPICLTPQSRFRNNVKPLASQEEEKSAKDQVSTPTVMAQESRAHS